MDCTCISLFIVSDLTCNSTIGKESADESSSFLYTPVSQMELGWGVQTGSGALRKCRNRRSQ